jgi:hypothetical protein
MDVVPAGRLVGLLPQCFKGLARRGWARIHASQPEPLRFCRPPSRSALRTSKSFSGLKNWSSARCTLRSPHVTGDVHFLAGERV